MRRFVSLPFKIMALILAFLVFVSIIMTTLWISENDQDYLTQQQTLREQDQKQFQFIKGMLRNRIESWFESFIHFQEDYANRAEATALFLEHEFEFFKLNWQIINLWLLDEQTQVLFTTALHTPDFVITDAKEVLQQQVSLANIRCATECKQLLTMPVLLDKNHIFVLAISSSLLEAMAALNQTIQADLAIVSPKPLIPLSLSLAAKNLQINSPISQSKRAFMQDILDKVPDALQISDLLISGYRLTSSQHDYLLNLIPLEPAAQNQLYLLAVHDITEATRAHQGYRFKVITVSVVVVVLCSLAIWMITLQFRQRLLAVTQRLPLLANKDYARFHQQKIPENSIFADEIDILQDTANLLGDELEKLDKSLEHNTRELENIALFDQLTGLPNRNKLNQSLCNLLADIQDSPFCVVVMFLDFDKFRNINDSYGHDVGDAFLIQAANTIRRCLRPSDQLFRLGGDEFVIAYKAMTDESRADELANALISHFHHPLKVGERHFYSTCSIGISRTTDAHCSIDDLIRQSDMAMYASKDAGGNQFSQFNQTMLNAVLRRVEIEHEVRKALEKEQFSFSLQPQVELSSGKLLGFEALIRWVHPQKGYISPDEFIPVIENTDSMISLGYWGLQRAFIILQKLDDIGFSHLKIAVNLSASQFMDPLLMPFLKRRLLEYSRDGSQIELELTERTVVVDIDQTLHTMQKLKELEFSFSIDDYGTGYSSLAYLKQMPVEVIKIDRSFVSAMEAGNADMKIVSSTIAMVNKLGMKVVAEGIETATQLQLLKDMNCDIGQGYFISRPIAENELYALLPQRTQNGIWINNLR